MENKPFSYILNEILGKVLDLSENPREFANYLSKQIRELVGARTIVITIKSATQEPQILSVFPERRTDWANQPSIKLLADKALLSDEIQYINNEFTEESIRSILQTLEINSSITVPLIAAKQKVGTILLLDLMDHFGIESVLELLDKLSGVFALIIRNSYLFRNMENLVDIRTIELQKNNEILTEREQQLLTANEEYEVLNEELIENNRRTDELNRRLQIAIKRAEKSEAQARDILQTAMDGFWLIDLQGRLKEVNEVACKMLGYNRQEMLSMSIADIEENETMDNIKEHLLKVTENGQDRFESKHRCKNGEIVNVELSVIWQAKQKLIVAFVHNITERKRTENKIIKEERSTRDLLNNLQAGVLVHAADTSIIRTNPRACELLGLTEDQLRGKTVIDPAWKFVRQDGTVMPLNEFPVNVVINTKKQLANYVIGVFQPSKNKLIWALVNGIPIFNSKNEIVEIIINFVNITELRETEQALLEKTAFMNKIIESSAISTWIADKNGTAIRTNQACLDLFGATEDEVIGKYNIFKDTVVERNGFMPGIRNAFDKGITANILLDYNLGEVDHVKVKNATHKIVNSIFTPVLNTDGEVMNVIVQTIDLTEIKQIEAKTIEERNKAQQYLNIAGVMLVSLDTEGVVQLINPKGCEVLGYTKDEILGKNWFNNFLPESDKAIVKLVEGKAFSGKMNDVEYFENKIKTKSGEERLIAWKNALLKDELGNITGTLSSGEDITDKKKAELELIQAKDKAEEGSRLKTAFLQNMSHEIRTPMNSIMGFASLLPDEDDKALIDNYSNIIVKNSEQLLHIIDDIVLFSRLQNKQMPLKIKQFDLQELLRKVKHSFDLPEYNGHVELVVSNFTDQPILVNSDYDKIWHVYTNLISNAFKYTKSGTISFGIFKENNHFIYYVKDTGMGIPQEERAKIFERFYRASNVTKGVIGGTGLGLSIVDELIQLLSGRIWVKSELDKGTTFYFSIT